MCLCIYNAEFIEVFIIIGIYIILKIGSFFKDSVGPEDYALEIIFIWKLDLSIYKIIFVIIKILIGMTCNPGYDHSLLIRICSQILSHSLVN